MLHMMFLLSVLSVSLVSCGMSCTAAGCRSDHSIVLWLKNEEGWTITNFKGTLTIDQIGTTTLTVGPADINDQYVRTLEGDLRAEDSSFLSMRESVYIQVPHSGSRSMHISLQGEGWQVEQDVGLNFGSSYPNGEECGPTCRSARVEIVVPGAPARPPNR